MFLAVGEIGADGLTVDRTVEVEPLTGPDGRALPLQPAHVSGTVRKAAGNFEFRGRIETIAELRCGRCLEPYRLLLELPFDLIYGEAPDAAVPGGDEPVDLDEEGPEFAPLDGGRIDLVRLVEESVYLALPLKPLCSEDCPGLCPRCGAPRRGDPCGCNVEDPDPRWSALEEIKRRLERS